MGTINGFNGTILKMQKNSIKNILRFIIRKPSRLVELSGKIKARLGPARERARDLEWIRKQQESFEAWAKQINAAAWEESLEFSRQLKINAKSKLSTLPFSMGGGGIYPVLYFITVIKKPEVIVETGVAAGYSSQTFLSALKKNGSGKLYSSDFPYFRLPNPEKYVGILVDDELRKDWNLFIDGDRRNLPVIMQQVDRIDLFHYDSDKSYVGRTYAFNVVKHKLDTSSYVLFDDIQDNNHFRDLVQQSGCNYKVFEFEGKYAGLIYNLEAQVQ